MTELKHHAPKPRQHHDPDFDLGIRWVSYSCRLLPENDAGRERIAPGSVGDDAGWVLWKADEGKRRGLASWSPAFSAIVENATAGSPPGETTTDVKAAGYWLKPAADASTPDDRYERKQCGRETWHSLLPIGWTGTVGAATDEDTQTDLWHPDFLGLVSAFRGKGEFSTRVVDCYSTDPMRVNPDSWAPLHSALVTDEVVFTRGRTPAGARGGPPVGHYVAQTLHHDGAEAGGFLSYKDDVRGLRALLTLSHEFGGPFMVPNTDNPADEDAFKVGQTDEGHPVMPLAFASDALWRPGRNAPTDNFVSSPPPDLSGPILGWSGDDVFMQNALAAAFTLDTGVTGTTATPVTINWDRDNRGWRLWAHTPFIEVDGAPPAPVDQTVTRTRPPGGGGGPAGGGGGGPGGGGPGGGPGGGGGAGPAGGGPGPQGPWGPNPGDDLPQDPKPEPGEPVDPDADLKDADGNIKPGKVPIHRARLRRRGEDPRDYGYGPAQGTTFGYTFDTPLLPEDDFKVEESVFANPGFYSFPGELGGERVGRIGYPTIDSEGQGPPDKRQIAVGPIDLTRINILAGATAGGALSTRGSSKDLALAVAAAPIAGTFVGWGAGGGDWSNFDYDETKKTKGGQRGEPTVADGGVAFLPGGGSLKKLLDGETWSGNPRYLLFPQDCTALAFGNLDIGENAQSTNTAGGIKSGTKIYQSSNGLAVIPITSTGISGDTAGTAYYSFTSDGFIVHSGDLTVNGKLTVTGLIDPTGLVFTEQSSDPMSGAQVGLYAGDTAGANEPWWRRDDGTVVNLLTGGGGGGGDHEVSDTNTNTSVEVVQLRHLLSSGTAAAGMGVQLNFALPDDGGTTTNTTRFDSVWLDPTDGSESATLNTYVMGNGTLSNMFVLDGDTGTTKFQSNDTSGTTGGHTNQFFTAATNAKKRICDHVLKSTGTTAAGFGADIGFQLQNASGSFVDAGTLHWAWRTTPTAGAEDSAIALHRIVNGSDKIAWRVDDLYAMRFNDQSDDTKTAAFDCSGITTATIRSFAFPDKDGTFAMTSDLTGLGTGDVTTGQTEADTGSATSKTWTIAAGTLASDGDWVRFIGSGRSAGGGGGTVSLVIAGTTVKTVASAVSQDACFQVLLVRTSNTQVQCTYTVIDGGGTAATATATVACTNLTTTAETIVINADSNYNGVFLYGPDA